MNHAPYPPAITCAFRSDWDVRKSGMSGSGSPMTMTSGDQGGSSWANQGPVGPTSRSTDCLDLDATNTGDLKTKKSWKRKYNFRAEPYLSQLASAAGGGNAALTKDDQSSHSLKPIPCIARQPRRVAEIGSLSARAKMAMKTFVKRIFTFSRQMRCSCG